MTYKPLETPFLIAARARGLTTVDGLAMLIGQAGPSFEAFFGRPAAGRGRPRGWCWRIWRGSSVIVLGLTGSIGMGKSTTAAMFADEGALVWDADAAVHDLYARGGAAVAAVEAAFPGVVGDGAVDRARLAEALGARPGGAKRLEAIVHPLVREHRADLTGRGPRGGARLAGAGHSPAVRDRRRRRRWTRWWWSPPRPRCSASGCWRGPA